MRVKPDHRTVYEVLESISKIKDREERKVALREYVHGIGGVGIYLQYVYHPDYDMAFDDSLKEVLPVSNPKYVSHDERAPFLQNIKRFKELSITSGIDEKVRQATFVHICEMVSSGDYQLMLALKDKKLPFRGLQEKFVVSAIPELFTPEQRTKYANATDDE